MSKKDTRTEAPFKHELELSSRMLFAVDLKFLISSVYLNDMMGQLFALFVTTVDDSGIQ